ncbi:MAG: alanine--tRNA ligase-related protein, partial [Candidatus Omnitrophica bacterium]|nr:alanine--tRNA ligase-related protein [Candidatus Omnitrophota bacterium]
GIPLELTKEWLDQQKISFSEEVFQQAMRDQKTRSKAGSVMKGDVFGAKGLNIKVEDSKFIGYKQITSESLVLAILKDDQEVSRIQDGEDAQIVLDQTPFYAESGGQLGDKGRIVAGINIFEVSDTKKINNIILHYGKVVSGSFKKQDKVQAFINFERRLNIARNHTATHLLQAALRKVLGNHVQQQGSLVGPEKFRFDFTHFKGLSDEEISRVEEIANEYVLKDYQVTSEEMPLKDAKKSGALAFFGEKYGEAVRVITVGDVSKELCGGTHLSNISEIGLIKIVSESSVASGIRRIEAVTAKFAEEFIKEQEQKSAQETSRINKLEEQKVQEKKRNAEMIARALNRLSILIENRVKIKDVSAIFSLEDNLDMSALRVLADKLKEKINQAVIVLGSVDKAQNKANLILALSKDLTPRGLNAQDLIRQVAPLIGGSGGGRQDFAQAGGVKIENLTLAIDKLRDIINKLI